MIGTLERKITLELMGVGVQARIPVRQGDSLVHRIIIGLMWNGRAYFPDDVTWAQVYACLPDGSTVTADCEIAEGKCTFVPGAGFFRCGGPVLCRLILRGADGSELYSPAFAFDAESSFKEGDEPYAADDYSKLAEILLQVLAAQKKCEDAAASMDTAGTEKVTEATTSIAERDWFTLYNVANDEYMRFTWESLRKAARKYLDGKLTAGMVTDEAETGYVATIPELEDDDTLVTGSQFEALAARVAELESKVTG